MDDGDDLGMKPGRKETLQREVLFKTSRCMLERVAEGSAQRVGKYSQNLTQTFAGGFF